MRFNTDVRPANDNDTAAGPDQEARPEPAERPTVRTPRGRPHATYACAHGVILPLRFARRMTGWNGERTARGPRGR